MRTVKAVAVVVAVLMAAFVGTPSADAASVVGSFSVNGSFEWVDNATCASASCTDGLSTANAVDFLTTGVEDNTPGVVGDMTVAQRSGDFLTLLTAGQAGTITDFSYFSPGTTAFPFPPSALLLEFESVGTIRVELLAITNVDTFCASGCEFTNSNPKLLIDGIVMFRSTTPDFEDTVGSFSFTGLNQNGAFSFSAAQAAVPEPSTLLLLGLGLAGFGVAGRRLKRQR